MAPAPHPHPDVDPLIGGLVKRELEERRFSALAAAIREHEARAAAHVVRGRPHDDALYRRLRQLSGRGS